MRWNVIGGLALANSVGGRIACGVGDESVLAFENRCRDAWLAAALR
jgi:hypothetical protein